MDFEAAAQRLAKDQQKIRGRNPVVVSATAKRQAEMQRKQREKLQAEREQKRRWEQYQRQYMRDCEKALHAKNLGNQSDEPLRLQPTSIHGTGDKISLPPSVLEILTTEMGNSSLGSPWTFRIGIPNPDYQFPASPLIQNLKPAEELDEDDHDDNMMDSDDEGERDDKLPFLDELAHKYIAYTHCTVVEFTQDEGHVGIPRHVASALLDPKNRLKIFADHTIPLTRTIDPAKSSLSEDAQNPTDDSATTEMEDDPTMATPGHVAYGAFDIPAIQLEISLVKLPKGRGCTLVPTKEAVQRGFYGLKDVKLVLEQSLIRTRATLSQGDIVSTWHRGVQYDLNVEKVIPSAFQAVTCINTDIEVEIGETSVDQYDPNQVKDQASALPSGGNTLGPGRTLGSATLSDATTVPIQHPSVSSTVILPPEPPVEQTENIVTVQIQFSGGSGKRRFDVTKATVGDLLQLASSLMSSRELATFQLVTRFPRRVFNGDLFSTTLQAAGIRPGQELFIVELV